jgi:hypothetical protein
LNVPASELQLFSDEKLTKRIAGKDNETLVTLKIKYYSIVLRLMYRNGDILHIGN